MVTLSVRIARNPLVRGNGTNVPEKLLLSVDQKAATFFTILLGHGSIQVQNHVQDLSANPCITGFKSLRRSPAPLNKSPRHWPISCAQSTKGAVVATTCAATLVTARTWSHRISSPALVLAAALFTPVESSIWEPSYFAIHNP